MGLDVYFRRDIANILCSTACASEGASRPRDPESAESVGYRRGVQDALMAVGLAFGLRLVNVEHWRDGRSAMWVEVKDA